MKMTAEQIRLSAVGKLNPEFSAGGVGGLQSSIRQAPRQPSCDCVSLSGQAHRTDCTARVSHKDEKELQEQIANWLRLHDTWFSRKRMDRKSTDVLGCPDFLLSINGVPLALEAKMPGNDLSPEQDQVRLQMQANGWVWHKVYRLEEVIAIIKLIQETHR